MKRETPQTPTLRPLKPSAVSASTAASFTVAMSKTALGSYVFMSCDTGHVAGAGSANVRRLWWCGAHGAHAHTAPSASRTAVLRTGLGFSRNCSKTPEDLVRLELHRACWADTPCSTVQTRRAAATAMLGVEGCEDQSLNKAWGGLCDL